MHKKGRRSGYTKRDKRMEEVVENFSDIKFTLNNGNLMPSVGFGTYRIRQGDEIMKVVDHALDLGYRMFDTAAVYNNESHLKKAFQTLLPKYGLEREDIFITTKLAPASHGDRERVEAAYRKSISNLGVDYVDLYLIHFPGTARLHTNDPKNESFREETWSSLEELYDDGLINAIGVSNFTVRHLNHLLMTNHSVIPAVNQVEWHPYYHQKELLDFCKQKDIVLQAYCSFGGTSSKNMDLMADPVVKEIADKYGVTNAQVLLVWALQQDVAVIPKSTNPERMKENISLSFRLDDEDMKKLEALGKKNIKYAWDPTNVS